MVISDWWSDFFSSDLADKHADTQRIRRTFSSGDIAREADQQRTETGADQVGGEQGQRNREGTHVGAHYVLHERIDRAVGAGQDREAEKEAPHRDRVAGCEYGEQEHRKGGDIGGGGHPQRPALVTREKWA